MRTAILTREWPPDVYGGAGVHVTSLAAELARIVDVEVHAFGIDRTGAAGHEAPAAFDAANAAIRTLAVDLLMASDVGGVDVVHSHTWYANLAGQLTAQLRDIPHIITSHSLEPRRPWKAEQLGGGYRISSWIERSAYAEASRIIAVSEGMRRDVLDCYPFVDPERVVVVHNGIDATRYRPNLPGDALLRRGLDPSTPYVLFVGRITRQKGLPHLMRAAAYFDDSVPLVICASAPDTPELGAEVADAVARLQAARPGVHWINEQLDAESVVQLFSNAQLFVCPSVYEPLGIVNLEAMACEVPVVASDVGGIPEVVADGTTGLLVHYDAQDPDQFERDLSDSVNRVLADNDLASRFGRAGRERVLAEFGWDSIARRTVEIYEAALAG